MHLRQAGQKLLTVKQALKYKIKIHYTQWLMFTKRISYLLFRNSTSVTLQNYKLNSQRGNLTCNAKCLNTGAYNCYTLFRMRIVYPNNSVQTSNQTRLSVKMNIIIHTCSIQEYLKLILEKKIEKLLLMIIHSFKSNK